MLLPLKRLKQTLEIPRPKPIKLMALDDLHKHRRPVSDMLRKDLQQIPALVKVDQDIQPLQPRHVCPVGPRYVREPLAEVGVVWGRDLEELYAACLKVCYSCDDVVCAEGDVLDACAVIILHESGC